jgi:hypothetical protein
MALVHDNAKDALLAHRAAQELYRLGCKGQTVQLSSCVPSLNGHDNIADASVGVSALMKIVDRLMSYFQSFYSLEEDLQVHPLPFLLACLSRCGGFALPALHNNPKAGN